ncbi:MAG: nitroreductase family protein [Methanophagales archaeon]|nr:nitroreductase family protein [Methanophagales archaeon]
MRGVRYVHMEVGHAVQNVYLQAVSLNLGTVVVGAFSDGGVKTIINMPEEEQSLYNNTSGEGVMQDAGFLIPSPQHAHLIARRWKMISLWIFSIYTASFGRSRCSCITLYINTLTH